MPRSVAQRLLSLVQSDIRRMTRECARVGGINLGQGICDLPTHPLVQDGAIEAIRARKSTYSYPEGILELRRAIAKKLERDNGITADPEAEIVVTAGATGAFTSAITALFDPGDGILLFEPYYGYHLNCILAVGLTPEFVELAAPHFAVGEEALRTALTPRTRAIVICTPSNPSGKMFTVDELAVIAKIAEERDLIVLTDEIYEYIRFDGRRHVSPATTYGLGDRTVTIMGLSKTFSITGWRLGYAVAPAPIARSIALVNDLYYICAPTPLQHGAAAGFGAPSSYFEGLSRAYQMKRDMLCEALESSGMPPIVPQGAYYVLADVTSLGEAGAAQAAMALLERAKVAAIPGTAFFRGGTGERFLRFCFAKEDDVLAEACARLRSFRT